VEGVEEEEVRGGEGTESTCGDQQGGTVVELFLAFRRFAGEQGGDGDDYGKENHDHAHAIDETEGEVEGRVFQNREGEGPETGFPGEGGVEAEGEIDPAGGSGRLSGGSAEKDGNEGGNGKQNEKREHRGLRVSDFSESAIAFLLRVISRRW
jgi:hypothetical protein